MLRSRVSLYCRDHQLTKKIGTILVNLQEQGGHQKSYFINLNADREDDREEAAVYIDATDALSGGSGLGSKDGRTWTPRPLSPRKLPKPENDSVLKNFIVKPEDEVKRNIFHQDDEIVDPERNEHDELVAREQDDIMQVLRSAVHHHRSVYGHKVSSYKDIFASVDKDGGGSLSEMEFELALHRMGLGLTHKQVSEVVEAMDKDHDGSIEYEEFIDAITHRQHHFKAKAMVDTRRTKK